MRIGLVGEGVPTSICSVVLSKNKRTNPSPDKTWIYLPHLYFIFNWIGETPSSVCLITILFLIESANLLCRFAKEVLFFFPWWKKNQKNQDLDLFAKKWKFLQRKSPNLRGSEVLASNKDYCRASDKGDFYTIII